MQNNKNKSSILFVYAPHFMKIKQENYRAEEKKCSVRQNGAKATLHSRKMAKML